MCIIWIVYLEKRLKKTLRLEIPRIRHYNNNVGFPVLCLVLCMYMRINLMGFYLQQQPRGTPPHPTSFTATA